MPLSEENVNKRSRIASPRFLTVHLSIGLTWLLTLLPFLKGSDLTNENTLSISM